MNVAFAMDAEELKRFDAWRGKLARGAALVQLLDGAEQEGQKAVLEHPRPAPKKPSRQAPPT